MPDGKTALGLDVHVFQACGVLGNLEPTIIPNTVVPPSLYRLTTVACSPPQHAGRGGNDAETV
jgi:hypothetical protein